MEENTHVFATENQIRMITPRNVGWIERRLPKQAMDHLWKCIENRGESNKRTLAGNVRESNELIDENNWFFNNILVDLVNQYASSFINLGNTVPTSCRHSYVLDTMWVNFQKQNEFNPVHNHSGVYSFVVWMKIPTTSSEQNSNPIARDSNLPCIGNFAFQYQNIVGDIKSFYYEMSPEMEGGMVLFPSKLMHAVYPFFNCQEERISISGNISLDTSNALF